MSATKIWGQIRHAVSNLNPDEVRTQVERPVLIGLVGASQESLGAMETFFAPPELSPARRAEAARILVRGGSPDCNIHIYESELLLPAQPIRGQQDSFSLDLDSPEDCVRRIVRRREDVMLALARRLPPFRKAAAHHIVRSVAKENALFSLMTALPDVVPGLSLGWAMGEFGSDAAFLTMNQIRMGFLLAAASDRRIGYREQRGEIASIAAGAFGWRALARELVGKVPFGGGLIPKAAIAWAGTFVVGMSLERLYRLGYGYTRAERKVLYEDSYEQGRQIAKMLLAGLNKKTPSLRDAHHASAS